jgi:inner membrane protease subunit 1
MIKQLKEILVLLPVMSTYYLINEKVITSNKTEGDSMDPTIKNNGVVIVDKIFFKLFPQLLKKDSIIIAQSPIKPDIDICKRILACEGEIKFGT